MPFAIIGVIATLIITFFFSRYELQVGKEARSPSLIADARHIYTDFLTSAVILVGLIGGYFGLPLDRPAALVVAIFIGWAGARIALDAIKVLLDASLDFDTMEQLKKTIADIPQVVEINQLRGRNSGRYTFIEADVSLRVKELDKSHFASHEIERKIRQFLPNVDSDRHSLRTAKQRPNYWWPRRWKKIVNISRSISVKRPVYYLATIRQKDGNIVQEKFIPNPFFQEDKGKGIKVGKWLLELGVDQVYTIKTLEGKGPGYVLADAGVSVNVVENGVLSAIKNNLS